MEDLGIDIFGTIEEAIASVISDKLSRKKINLVMIDKSTTFDSIGFDSLDVMEIIIECEGLTHKKIANKRIKNIYTINDLYNLFKYDN